MNSFTFYQEYSELISLLPEEEQKDLIYAIVNYMIYDKEPVLNERQKKIFINLKRPLDVSKNNSKRSKGNGAPTGNNNASKNKPKTNQKQTENNPEDKPKTNTSKMSMSMSIVNVNVYKNIIEYLNNKTNSHYKHTTSKTMKLIQARLNENFTIDDFKKVIDNKSQEWMGTEFENYLRPETLFGNKFESYLNQKNNKPIQKPMTYQERKKQEEDKMWKKFLAGGKENE